MEKGLLNKGPSNEYSSKDRFFTEYVGRIRGTDGEGLKLDIQAFKIELRLNISNITD